MKDKKDILVMVLARLESERVPNKMVLPICNSNLFQICLNKLKLSKIIPQENIYVSVYNQELINISKKLNVNIWNRSKKSVNSEAESLKELYDFWDKLNYKYVITINPCHLFYKLETIEDFYLTFLNSKNEGLFSVIKKKNYFFDLDGKIIVGKYGDDSDTKSFNTKRVEEIYEAEHGLQASKLEWIKNEKWLGTFKKKNDPELYVIKKENFEYFDIDYQWQFNISKKIYESN
jgi:CMP-N-acetylneuraminic acid synthetase